MKQPSRLDKILNNILDHIFDVLFPIMFRLMGVAFIVLCFLGVIMATTNFNLMNPDTLYELPTSATLFLQAAALMWWPVTIAPFWWQLSFFVTGFLLLLYYIWFRGDF